MANQTSKYNFYIKIGNVISTIAERQTFLFNQIYIWAAKLDDTEVWLLDRNDIFFVI